MFHLFPRIPRSSLAGECSTSIVSVLLPDNMLWHTFHIESPAWKAPTLDTLGGTGSARRLISLHTVQVLSLKILDSVGVSQGTLSDTSGHCVAG
jgi:hypothetical protein